MRRSSRRRWPRRMRCSRRRQRGGRRRVRRSRHANNSHLSRGCRHSRQDNAGHRSRSSRLSRRRSSCRRPRGHRRNCQDNSCRRRGDSRHRRSRQIGGRHRRGRSSRTCRLSGRRRRGESNRRRSCRDGISPGKNPRRARCVRRGSRSSRRWGSRRCLLLSTPFLAGSRQVRAQPRQQQEKKPNKQDFQPSGNAPASPIVCAAFSPVIPLIVCYVILRHEAILCSCSCRRRIESIATEFPYTTIWHIRNRPCQHSRYYHRTLPPHSRRLAPRHHPTKNLPRYSATCRNPTKNLPYTRFIP